MTKLLILSNLESIEEEFERLTGYIFSPSNTIIQSKFSSPRGPTTHHKTLEKCIGLNKRLSMETKTLKQQLTSAEGEANYLLTENESLRKEIEDLERGKILPWLIRLTIEHTINFHFPDSSFAMTLKF